MFISFGGILAIALRRRRKLLGRMRDGVHA
jgi:hypothetical protein